MMRLFARGREGNSLVVILIFTIVSGCAGTKETQFALSSSASYSINQPIKSPGCYDAAVLLPVDQEASLALAKKVTVALDAAILTEEPSLIEAQRNRHFGLFVGSGGEEIVVRLTPDASGNTLVAVTTKTGFVGGAGQKAWSCTFVDNLVQLAS